MRKVWYGLLCAVFAIAMSGSAAAADPGSIDWSSIKAEKFMLFYPGASTWDWMLTKEHKKGYQKLPKGDACVKCHENDENMVGQTVLEQGIAEPEAAPNRRPFIELAVQAAYDSENLYLRFQWESASTGGGKEPDGVAVMIADGNPKDFRKHGCWLTCHDGMRDTRNEPGKDAIMAALGEEVVHKYLPESRSDDKASWDKVKPADALAALRADGGFVDLWRWKSDGKVTDESVLEYRRKDAGDSAGDVQGSGELKDGVYTVVMWRKIDTGHPEDDKIPEVGKGVFVGFAVHDNDVGSRYHYTGYPVSIGIGSTKGTIVAAEVD